MKEREILKTVEEIRDFVEYEAPILQAVDDVDVSDTAFNAALMKALQSYNG